LIYQHSLWNKKNEVLPYTSLYMEIRISE